MTSTAQPVAPPRDGASRRCTLAASCAAWMLLASFCAASRFFAVLLSASLAEAFRPPQLPLPLPLPTSPPLSWVPPSAASWCRACAPDADFDVPYLSRRLAFQLFASGASVVETTTRKKKPAKKKKKKKRKSNEELWDERLEELRCYRDEHGHVDVKRTGPNPTLGSWAARQRRDYAAWKRGGRSPLTDRRREALEALGFAWTTKNGDERWADKWAELRRFGEERGHVDVPENDIRYRELATWVKNQRTEYRRWRDGRPTTLTDERRLHLDKLGFCWDVHEHIWRRRFRELQEFRAAHGHCNVPMSHGSLGDWVLKVRTNYNRLRRGREPMQASLLTDERIANLTRIGFDFDPLETQFRERLEELRQFKEENGHINVGSKRGKLSGWYYRQRAAYKKLLAGSNATGLTDDRRKALEDVGFHPGMYNVTMSPPKVEGRARWEDRLNELCRYRDEHGDCNVPWSQGALGRWVKEQRASCFNETRIALLNDVGFIWDVRDYLWWKKFEDLRRYKEERGDCNVPHSYGGLGEWVTQQRNRHKRGRGGTRLTDARKSALDGLGFVWDRGEEIKSHQEAEWDEKFQHLRRYKEEHGDCQVPRSQGTLSNWVRLQRTQYRALLRKEKSNMTERRRKKLDFIGFE